MKKKAFKVTFIDEITTVEEQKKLLEKLDPVSGLNPEARVPEMCVDMMKLNFLGDGYILFYSFMTQLMFIAFIFGLANLFRTYEYLKVNACG